ncbi:MAG: hypothetical protein ACLFRT_10500, partial [Actinomycetota bacterium]
FSGVAAAEEHEPEETEDTIFNFGYDEDNSVFIWGSSPSDAETDCTLENGAFQATYDYDNGDDGGLLLQDLAHLEGEGEEQEVGDIVDSDCELTAGEVAGPQGQINHGMFLKTFNAMFDGQARGCLVRHIAQSDLGKGDDQINVPDVEETEEIEEENSIDFETVMTDCVNGEDENGEVDGQAKAADMRPESVNDRLEDKAANGGDDVESQDDDGRRGPPEGAPGKGPKG